jgi:aminopeptidase 2
LKRASYKNEIAVGGLNALQRSIFSPKVEALGYDFSDSDDHLTVLKRTLAIKCAAEAEDQSVIKELLSRYQKFAAGDINAFNGNLRPIVFCTALKHSTNPQADFDTVFSRYYNGVTIDEKVSAVSALGASNDVKIVKNLLDCIIFDAEKVKPQDTYLILHSLSEQSPIRGEVTELLWKFFTKNWTYLCEKTTPAIHGRTAKYTIIPCIGEEAATRIEQFAVGADCTSEELKKVRVKQFGRVERPYLQALESMRAFTKWYERDCENVCQWLSKNNFQ